MEKGGPLYLSELSLRRELMRLASAEASMLEDWLHHNLFYPAAKKRGEESGLQRIDLVPSDVPVQKMTAPSPLHWSRQGEKVNFVQWLFLPISEHWSGKSSLRKTTFASTVLACLMLWAISFGSAYVFDPDHYFGNWIVFRAYALFISFAVGAIWIWWGVGVMRFALRSIQSMKSLGVAFFIFVLGLLSMISSTAFTIEEGYDWAQDLKAPIDSPKVIYDELHDRIVFDGDVGWGAYRQVQKVLTEHPRTRLLELKSPGGYVIEGLAISRLIKQSGMDTVAFQYCHSACTFIFAAGKARFLGPKVEIGFHRSSVFGQPIASEWTGTEYRVARYFKAQGVEEDFIKTAFSYPGDDLWIPTHGHMLDSGYASLRWVDK
jgi:hypothetical protein